MIRPLAIVTASALAGAASLANPVDVIVRGKFVRHFQTREGEAAATVCLPARTQDELAAQISELPALLVDLERAGARVVALDFEADAVPPAVFSATSLPVAVGHPAAGGALGGGAVVAHRQATTAGPAGVVVSVPSTGGGSPPLAAVALALHRGGAASSSDLHLSIGDQGWPAPTGEHTFMPYLIPFLDWEDRESWSGVAGRTVFVGACRLDRHLTRFGRQPAVVAHGELLESLRDGAVPREAPRAADALLSALVSLAALGAGRAWPRLGPVVVGLLAVAVVAALQLHGSWLGLTGVVVGAALPLLARRT